MALPHRRQHKEKLEENLDDMERGKKAALKELAERPEFANLDVKSRKDNEAYAQAAEEISGDYAAQAEELRYRLTDIYEERRSGAFATIGNASI